MRPLILAALAATSLGVAACSSNYHPEYHPVTVTSYEQHVSSQTSGSAGPPGASGTVLAAPGATLAAPPPPTPPAPPPWSAWPSE